MFSCLTKHLRYALLVMLIILVIVLLSKWSGTKDSKANVEDKEDSPQVSKNLSRATNSQVASLVANALSWKQKSDMDQDPRAALMHSTYATAYLDAARTLSSDSEISRKNQINVDEVSQSLQQRQQQSIQAL